MSRTGSHQQTRRPGRKSVELRAVVEIRGTAGIEVGSAKRTRIETLLRDISPVGFQFIVPGRMVASVLQTKLLTQGSMVTLELELSPSRIRISIVGSIAWVAEPSGHDQPLAVGVRAMPELADAASRRAFARWVAVAT